MAKITSESAFEEHIEEVLLKTHGYFSAAQEDYDKALCLRPETVISFIRATQTKKWADYWELIGDKDTATRNLLKRIKEVVDKEGTLHALRKGFDIIGGGHFDLCYFEPTNPVAEESRRLYRENLLHIQRQVKFSESDEKSLDMGIFLNGLPIFTIELKNQISGQNVGHAMRQYKDTRDPKEPLFEGLATQSLTQNLMTQANPEDGDAGVHECLHLANNFTQRCRKHKARRESRSLLGAGLTVRSGHVHRGKRGWHEGQRYYYGSSQGGILGGTYMALSTDVERGLLDTAGQPYHLLLPRSGSFDEFFAIIKAKYDDPLHVMYLLALAQILFDRTEPNGYSQFIERDLFPGTPSHRVIIRPALGDHQVTNLGAHVMARAVGAAHLDTGLREVWGLEQVSSPYQGSALVEYDFGIPTDPLDNLPQRECHDPHDVLRTIPEGMQQLDHFWRTGEITNFCAGACSFPELSGCE